MTIEQIIKQVKNYERLYAPQFARMTDIYRGNLSPYVLDSMRSELSSESFSVASKRVAPINVFQKVITKLSQVYTQEPKRVCANPRDTELVTSVSQSADIQNVISNAEIMLNINRQFLLEPYIRETDGVIQVRLLSPSEFVVLSTDSQNPLSPTVVVKIMGNDSYWIYTKENFYQVEKNAVVGSQENPYQELPFVYCTQDLFSLSSSPDNDSFNISILIPKLLTDLNYAVQFQSHSVMYGIDLNPQNLQGGPDAFWSIKSEEGEGKKPSIGILSPQVDVDKVLSLIQYTTSQWLENKGIKPGSVDSRDNSASGISKIIDEADTTSIVDKNRILLVKAEKALWRLIGKMHNMFINTPRAFGEPLEVSISFPLKQIIPNPSEKRESIKFQLDNGLTTMTRALQELNPDLSREEIEILKQEIELEKNKLVAVPQEGVISNGKE